jgi:hypothetical protein
MEPPTIATCFANDLRNIFLVHDKRILVIVLQQLSDLEARNVLNLEERVELEKGICHTLLPKTKSIADLLPKSRGNKTLEDRHLSKAVHDASGRGVPLGSYMTQEDWLELLKHHTSPLIPRECCRGIQELSSHI